MQSEASDPVWGPGIVPIILRNLCPGCQRLRLDTETEVFYPTDFKPEGLGHMAEGWCNGIGCMPDEQGVPACAADQVGPRGEDGPTGPCGGPIGPCGPDCVRFVTVSDLPAGQPNKNEDIISPDAIVGTPLSQPNAIQALWDKSTISVPSEHVRGISIQRLSRDHYMPGDKTYPLVLPKPLIEADYAGIELRVAEARIGADGAESERPGIHFSQAELPEADRMLLLVLRAMSSMLTGPVSHGGLMGPCQHNCSGLCGKIYHLQPQPQVWVSCGVIRQFRQLYAAYTAKGDRSIAELQRDMATSTELIRQNHIPADAEQLWQAEKQRVEAKQKKAAELVLMPKELTAENGAKALLSGEFYEKLDVANPDYDPDCDDPDNEDYDEDTAEPAFVTERVPVTWDTIKKIYKMCVKGLSQPLSENKP